MRVKRSFFIATVATVLIAGFSGLFYVETERIWIFLTPAFALAAGYEAAPPRGAGRARTRLPGAVPRDR